MKGFFSTVMASVVLSGALAAGCGDDGGGEGALVPKPDCTELTYEADGKPFVDKYCITCHTSTMVYGQGEADDYDFDTVADIRLHGRHIIKHAIDGAAPAMPPEGLPQPDDTELAKMDEWFGCGAP